jgi:predicted kinase
MLVGLPGSGKSTLARRIAPAIDAVILESDALRRRFFGQPTHDNAESKALFAAINAAAERLLKEGVSVVVDATNLKEQDRRPIEILAHETRSRLIVAYVTATARVIEGRLERREASAAFPSASTAGLTVYRRMLRTMQPPAPEECVRVDTSDEKFYEAAVQKIIREAANQVPEGSSSETLPAQSGGGGRLRPADGSKGGSWGGRS